MSDDKKPKLGLGLNSTVIGRTNKTKAPKKVEPTQSQHYVRTLPDDQILVKPTRRLTMKETSKSVLLKKDTHMAIKQIASIEDKRMYEVIDEIVEGYVKEMPASSKKVILNSVREVQKNMPKM